VTPLITSPLSGAAFSGARWGKAFSLAPSRAFYRNSNRNERRLAMQESRQRQFRNAVSVGLEAEVREMYKGAQSGRG